MIELLMNFCFSNSVSHISHFLKFAPLIIKLVNFTSNFCVQNKVISTVNLRIPSFTNEI